MKYARKEKPPGFYSGGHQHLVWVKHPSRHFEPLTQYHTRAWYRIPHIGELAYSRESEVRRVYELDRVYQVRLRSQPTRDFNEHLWHGTPERCVSSIGHESLRPSTWGLLGPGVYVTPDLNKAFGYTSRGHRRGWYYPDVDYHWAFVFLCGVYLKLDGYKYAGSGPNATAYGGRLQYSEYCIRDPEDVVPLFLCVYHWRQKTKKE